MGQPIDDAEDASYLRLIQGYASEDGERLECHEGPNGASCPTCASTRRPWYMGSWRCPECGHIKGAEPTYRERYDRVMCAICFEKNEVESAVEASIARWGEPVTVVNRILADFQMGHAVNDRLQALGATERDELYSRATRSLRELMDRLDHPAGRNL